MYKILRSQIDSLIGIEDFDQQVQDYIAALTAHTKTVGMAPPVAHSVIENSVKRIQEKGKPDWFEADYEILEDVVPMPLANKKDGLIQQVRLAEQALADKIWPPGKRRLLQMDLALIYAKTPDKWTDKEKALVKGTNELNAKIGAVSRLAAEAEFAIEDLTEETVDSYQVPNLEG